MINQLHNFFVKISFNFNDNKTPKIKQPVQKNFQQKITRTVSKMTPALRHMLEKMTILLIPLPLFMLAAGIEGLIAQESPASLASLSSVSTSFLSFLDFHTLIIAGAFGVTFIIWFVTRRVWFSYEDDTVDYDEEALYEMKGSDSSDEDTEEYESFVDKNLIKRK